MPRAALTDEQIREFRARAVDAATELFAHEGYESVTMRSLASELGVSPMTPYRYFADKEDLFAAVRTEAFRRFADRQQRAFEGESDPVARLGALHAAYVQSALDEPEAYRIMFELRPKPAGEYPELEAQTARSFSYLQRAVADAIEAGLMRGDALSMAHHLWAGVHGLVSLHLAGKLTFGRSLEDLAACIMDTLPGGER